MLFLFFSLVESLIWKTTWNVSNPYCMVDKDTDFSKCNEVILFIYIIAIIIINFFNIYNIISKKHLI